MKHHHCEVLHLDFSLAVAPTVGVAPQVSCCLMLHLGYEAPVCDGCHNGREDGTCKNHDGCSSNELDSGLVINANA